MVLQLFIIPLLCSETIFSSFQLLGIVCRTTRALLAFVPAGLFEIDVDDDAVFGSVSILIWGAAICTTLPLAKTRRTCGIAAFKALEHRYVTRTKSSGVPYVFPPCLFYLRSESVLSR